MVKPFDTVNDTVIVRLFVFQVKSHFPFGGFKKRPPKITPVEAARMPYISDGTLIPFVAKSRIARRVRKVMAIATVIEIAYI